MAAVRLHETDDGVGATFPDDLLVSLNVGEGDLVDIRRTPDGILLTASDTPRDDVRIARRVMDENSEVLRALAI